jgi:hypothetical protein
MARVNLASPALMRMSASDAQRVVFSHPGGKWTFN